MKISLARVLFSTCLFAFLGCSREAEDHAGHDDGAHADAHRPAAEITAARAGSGEEGQRLWCGEHEAYEDLCFICHPELREKGRLWCNEHARYEDRCWLCHPELEDKARPYCEKHYLFQDECFLCRPELKPAADATPPGAATGLFCSEHGMPEAECGICHPELLAGLEPGQGVKVRLPSDDSADLAGIETTGARPGALSEGVTSYAEIAYAQNRMALVAAPVDGIVQQVSAELGTRVGEYQSLAQLWSATIAEAVARAVLTHQTVERERRLRRERVTSEQDLQRAEAEHRMACQQLRTFGFEEADVDAMGERPQDAVYLDVRAPLSGEIVARHAVRGERVAAGTPLFTVADRSVMWAMLNLPQTGLAHVREGQEVELVVDALPGRIFRGKLTWIAPEVDERTRMARARAEIDNSDGVLRARMFARARVVTDRETAVVVPAGAIQQVEGRPLVFIRVGPDLFEARPVTLGPAHEGRQLISAGLKPGEEVVAEGAFAVKSQLLLSRLGAGCVHD
jgi:cobalt-zinc-cadmium efflux system membrane fusion protein